MEDNNGGYYGFVETTIDPGYLLLAVAGLICVISLLSVPCLVSCVRRARDVNRRKRCAVDAEVVETPNTDSAAEQHVPKERPLSLHRTPSSKECDGAHYTKRTHEKDGVSGDEESGLDEGNFERDDLDDATNSRYPASVSESDDAPSNADEQNFTTILDVEDIRSIGGKIKSSVCSRTFSSQPSSIAPEPSVLDTGFRRRRRADRRGNAEKRRLRTARGVTEEGRISVIRKLKEQSSLGSHTAISLMVGEFHVEAPTDERLADTYLPKRDAQSVTESADRPNDSGNCCLVTICNSFDFLVSLSEYDNEMKRILRLAVPFLASEIIEAVLDSVQLALVSLYIGTDAMVAFGLTDIVVGITSEFVGGFIECESSLLSHAFGSGNNHLAGQYVQLCCVFYVLFQIPFIILWSVCMDDVMLAMGFDNGTAQMAQQFARLAVFIDIVEGISEGFYDFLEVIERELYANVLGNIEAIVETGLIAIAVIVFNGNLMTVGSIMIVNIFLFMVMNLAFMAWKGWIRPFMPGLFRSCAFKNSIALRQVIKTATPLAFGSVMAYGEWEILTVFAAYLGPAEVATWTVLGSIWETFEASTEGIGDAAEVRCAYHLGKNNPEMAKVSAYKSIYVASIFSVFATSIFFMMGESLPTWFTNDPTLQHMLAEQLPLVGMGNITFTMGMVCWALVGSQKRYRLATSVVLLCSWLVIIPLGALVTYGLRLNLQGLTFAIVVGYAVASAILSSILLLSDWERLSREVQEINRMRGEVLSSDSSSSSSSSNSSSSSSSSSSADDSTTSNDSDSVASR